MTEVAVKCDLGFLFGTARDQGDRPTCLAFAASDAHAALRAGWEPLSCEYAFYQAQRRSLRRLRRNPMALMLDKRPDCTTAWLAWWLGELGHPATGPHRSGSSATQTGRRRRQLRRRLRRLQFMR